MVTFVAIRVREIEPRRSALPDVFVVRAANAAYYPPGLNEGVSETAARQLRHEYVVKCSAGVSPARAAHAVRALGGG